MKTLLMMIALVMTAGVAQADTFKLNPIRNDGTPRAEYKLNKKKEHAEIKKHRRPSNKRFYSQRYSYGAGIYTPNYSPYYGHSLQRIPMVSLVT